MPAEGVTKYSAILTKDRADKFDKDDIDDLMWWRDKLYELGLIGQDPERYGGVGFGNVSKMLTYERSKRRPFVITGTQTGGLEHLDLSHYTTVLFCNPRHNRVYYDGSIAPSSECMTHDAVYQLGYMAVFHVHSPVIWRHSKELQIPTTQECIEFGTPEMAEDVQRLYRETDMPSKQILSMGGHQDGVVSFGYSVKDVGTIMIAYFRRAERLEKAE